jgi:hypothetical protein
MNALTITQTGGGFAPRGFLTTESTEHFGNGTWSRMRTRVVDIVTKDGFTLRAIRGNQRGVNLFGQYRNHFAKHWRVCFVGRGPWVNTWPKADAATIRDIAKNGAGRYRTITHNCVTSLYKA